LTYKQLYEMLAHALQYGWNPSQVLKNYSCGKLSVQLTRVDILTKTGEFHQELFNHTHTNYKKKTTLKSAQQKQENSQHHFCPEAFYERV